MNANIEALVKKHEKIIMKRAAMRAALTEQAETHAIELRAYEATVANLNERIRQLEAERVPEGWKLVPVEPTAEQIFAMDSFSEMCFEQFGRDADTDEFYRAGIAAAPQPKKEGE